MLLQSSSYDEYSWSVIHITVTVTDHGQPYICYASNGVGQQLTASIALNVVCKLYFNNTNHSIIISRINICSHVVIFPLCHQQQSYSLTFETFHDSTAWYFLLLLAKKVKRGEMNNNIYRDSVVRWVLIILFIDNPIVTLGPCGHPDIVYHVTEGTNAQFICNVDANPDFSKVRKSFFYATKPLPFPWWVLQVVI